MLHVFAALTRERPSALRAALMRSLKGVFTGCEDSICDSRDAHHSATCSKAMSNVIQIAAGVYIVAIIGFVVLYNRVKDWLCGVPPVSMKQRERMGTCRLRQIMKGRATHRDVLQLEPSESELDQEEAEIAAEIAAKERRQAAKQAAAPPAQPAVTPQDVSLRGWQSGDPPSCAFEGDASIDIADHLPGRD